MENIYIKTTDKGGLMRKVIQGIGLGLTLILPGMSGGTFLIIFGFYHKFIADLARIQLRPYLPFFIGTAIGIIIGAQTIGFLLTAVPNLLVSFLLGALLASVRLVFPFRPQLTTGRLLALASSLLGAWLLASKPLAEAGPVAEETLMLYLAGGALSSATMLLPGVSGSALLVVIGLYDNVITALNQRQLLNLFVLACGWGIGLFSFAHIISSLYRRHFQTVSFVLAGLIIGSSRSLLPATLTFETLFAFISGAFLVTAFGGREKPPES